MAFFLFYIYISIYFTFEEDNCFVFCLLHPNKIISSLEGPLDQARVLASTAHTFLPFLPPLKEAVWLCTVDSRYQRVCIHYKRLFILSSQVKCAAWSVHQSDVTVRHGGLTSLCRTRHLSRFVRVRYTN